MSYIAIVDYGAGNLMSVHNTLDYLGYENKIADRPEIIEQAAGVILPGVGAFPDAMQALQDSGLTDAVLAAAKTKPFLGICLGMQMLFEESDEVRLCKGLGCCPDASSAFRPRSSCRRSAGMHCISSIPTR